MKSKDLAFSSLFPRAPRRAAAALTAVVLAMAWGAAVPALAAEHGLDIELNKVEDADGGCDGSFLVRNGLGHTLDRFSMELALFGTDGVLKNRIRVNMAPLPGDKTTVAKFTLSDGRCDGLSRVLINAFPNCRSSTGEAVDCLAGLTVSSRGGIELFK